MASFHNMDLKIIRGLRSSPGYFKKKEFLSVEKIYRCLKWTESQYRWLNNAGKTMKSNIEKTSSDLFLHLPIEFPVTGLQHVTTEDCMRMIMDSNSFRGRDHEREEFTELSFWGTDIPSSNIEKAREETYIYVQERVSESEAYEYRKEITEQFANSPAFNKSASRYGNFRFSLPFSDLLSLYGTQFCNGEKPQLSILGTDIYKQEIAHYVVVHRPGDVRFETFQRVPSLQTRREDLPYVYWMGDRLYWRPESTSDSLKVLTKNGEITGCNQPEPCDWYTASRHCIHAVSCAWNQLVFAFHIPYSKELEIPAQKLIDNLSACDPLEKFLKDDSKKLTKSKAKKIIKKMKAVRK